MTLTLLINLAYIAAAVLFILGLKLLASPTTARQGNLISALGMLVAVIATLLDQQIIDYRWILLGLVVGSTIGIMFSRLVQMTQMPEMVALLNGFGGLASLLVAWAAYDMDPAFNLFTGITIALSILIGGVTFSGSMVAWAKLNGRLDGRPVLFMGQQPLNILLALLVILGSVFFVRAPTAPGAFFYFAGLIVLSLLLGVTTVIPIGGADMPVVISLLNSYSGLAACTTGFVINNNVLIVSGALVGASGIILTKIMCKAMNRSLTHVLFSGFGSSSKQKAGIQGEAQTIGSEDTYYLLDSAQSVVVVPGYGLAVAQAQHVLHELTGLLEKNGAEVKFAIHPVAGRMPGHMNVLLAEANVPYDQLVEMDDINPQMESVDVCLVIGANDVVNPAARDDEASAIYGMPIIEVDKAKTVIILKRSLGAGFAGVDNPLFFKENARMLLGDAKASLSALVTEFKH